MRTLINNTDKISYFKILDNQEFSIDENKVIYEDCIYPMFNSNNCTVLEISSLPDDWQHACFKYENETFTQVIYKEEVPNE